MQKSSKDLAIHNEHMRGRISFDVLRTLFFIDFNTTSSTLLRRRSRIQRCELSLERRKKNVHHELGQSKASHSVDNASK